VLILFRQSMREVLQLIHPRGRFLVKLGTISVPGQVLAAVTGFCMLYVLCFVVMTLMVAATGVDLITAFSAVATCINNMGPGLGQVSVSFAGINDTAVWICAFAMILGRLEIFTVLVLLTPAFWRE
jgi:trk system potassium uptake protein TrkH